MTDIQSRQRDSTDLDADILVLRSDRSVWHPDHGAPVNVRIMQQLRALLIAANAQYGLPCPTVDSSHTGDITVAWHLPPYGQAGGETDMADNVLNLFSIDCTPGTSRPAQFTSINMADTRAAEQLTRFIANT